LIVSASRTPSDNENAPVPVRLRFRNRSVTDLAPKGRAFVSRLDPAPALTDPAQTAKANAPDLRTSLVTANLTVPAPSWTCRAGL